MNIIHPGVGFNKRMGKYTARATLNGIRVFLGYFDSHQEASSCRDSFIISNKTNGKLSIKESVGIDNIPNTKLIMLTRGKFAIVDDDDFERVNQYNWFANKIGNTYYALRHVTNDGKKSIQLMHHFIMGCKHEFIDHKNGDGLHNYKSNLRPCTKQQNQMNQRKQLNCSSVYKGVCFDKKYGKWIAYISKDYKRKHIGYFTEEKDAAIAYNDKAKELFGEFAKLNDV